MKFLKIMTLKKIFKSIVIEGLDRMRIEVSPPVQNYLGNLLHSYIQSDQLFDTDIDSGKKNLTPLAQIYLKAQKVSLSERLFLLKQVGDRSLYLGGFFRESLNKQLISLSYYFHIGQGAYDSLADHHPEEEIFRELSYHFTDLMDVLSYIASKHSIQTDEDLMKVCVKYLKTGSKIAGYQLEDHGFSVEKNNKPH